VDYVALRLKANRGWPWPEKSWGLDPMFGEGGWCEACGIPVSKQSGSLVLQSKGLREPPEAWVPHWQYDAICLRASLADEVNSRFDVELLKVEWRGSGGLDAAQVVIPSTREAWFSAGELESVAAANHGIPGAKCDACGIWRWMPLGFESVAILGEKNEPLPPLRIAQSAIGADVAASPEWFGDGCQSFRQVLIRRELAELLAARSPRDFDLQPVDWAVDGQAPGEPRSKRL
jgi:hypothetical protein